MENPKSQTLSELKNRDFPLIFSFFSNKLEKFIYEN